MNIYNTIAELDSITCDITDTLLPDLVGLRESEHVYTPRVQRHIDQIALIVTDLQDMHDDLVIFVNDEERATKEE